MPDIEALASQAATVTPYHPVIAAVSQEQAELSRLIGRGCCVNLPDLEADAVLRIQLCGLQETDWDSAIALHGPFGVIEIAQGFRLLRALCGIDMAQEHGADEARWSWLQAAMIGYLSGTPFHNIQKIERVLMAHPAEGRTLAVSLRTGTHVIDTVMRAPAATLIDFMRSTAWQREQQPLSELLDLHCESSVVLARHTLPAQAIGGIAAGDIVVPDSPIFTCDGVGALQLGAIYARVRYETPNLLTVTTLEEKVNPKNMETADEYEDMDDHEDMDDYDDDYDDSDDEDMDDYDDDDEDHGDDEDDDEDDEDDESDGDDEDKSPDKPDMRPEPPPPQKKAVAPAPAVASPDKVAGAASKAGSSPAVDSLPVTMDFVLGKVRMSLGEIRQLGAGSVLSFHGGSPASISITSAGSTLGRGEIVEVNGQLGIRITHWSKSK